jgi:hypothetical protein
MTRFVNFVTVITRDFADPCHTALTVDWTLRMEDTMLKVRAMLVGAAVIASVAGSLMASIYAEARMRPLSLAAPNQIDTFDLMTKAPANLPVQTADAI